MNKIMTKLIAAILALAVAASLAVVSSYAWLTISGAPEVNGVQVNIGGSNTIMVAADMVYVAQDGTVCHYPGQFGEDLDFSEYDTYRYLRDLAALSPVSTSDGVYWFLPEYYTSEDASVQSGLEIDGQIKDISDFSVDTTLAGSNQSKDSSSGLKGHYVYVDFWVVSPADGYKLRVSTGDPDSYSGSYVINLMDPAEVDTDGDDINDAYGLQATDQTAAASVRVGFLVNSDWAKYTDIIQYANSESYSGTYTKLVGQYQEAGESLASYSAADNRFTIYEPNGDLHPGSEESSLYYQITSPLGMENGQIVEKNISSILTVQTSSTWNLAENGTETMLEQEFQTAILGTEFGSRTALELKTYFYTQRLQGQLAAYLTQGRFIKSTQALYDAADSLTGRITQDYAALNNTAGATEDVYITVLQKNVPQRIRMFIWLEGQDEDCSNHSTASTIAVNIELAGSNQE